MNYITLNGKKSLLIKGLLISELPPITKPLVRTKIEEIDGRDGDIVTKLGYAAYDKKMSISLFGDFNIDDIIEYFDSEGTVIFSNEPDKFYRYQILNQIDFERLIRFRTATVVFHVQPFKHSSVDDTMTFDNLSGSSGSISSRNNGNVIARPEVTVYGSGMVTLSLNGKMIGVSISSDGYITLNGETMNAYKGDTLKNRSITGNLKYLYLPVGRWVIPWTGSVSKIVVKDGSRWI